MIYDPAVSVLVLRHVINEGPGTIEDYLQANGIDYSIADALSEDLRHAKKADTLVIMGGPMSVNETDVYPSMVREIDLVQASIREGKKVLGICLGAQIMARALGARVYAGPEKEIGWYDIELQGEGIRDPMMKRLAVHPRAGDFWKKFKVFHWHGETFDLPDGAVRLARSDMYPNQAFRYGNGAYAFQFHIEVKKEMIYDWLKDGPVDMSILRRETEYYYDDYNGRAVNFYDAFFRNVGAASLAPAP